ncbi:hypothetical protein KQH86_03090 [Weissella confusa]|nr:hypothetical protein [Weissella confusa]MBU5285102.1 hypothetical protein [Weissella confusa]
MAIKFETLAVLDTGKVVRSLEDTFHEEWQMDPGTTYVKFQEKVMTEE